MTMQAMEMTKPVTTTAIEAVRVASHLSNGGRERLFSGHMDPLVEVGVSGGMLSKVEVPLDFPIRAEPAVAFKRVNFGSPMTPLQKGQRSHEGVEVIMGKTFLLFSEA
jgi:hypothetical protein